MFGATYGLLKLMQKTLSFLAIHTMKLYNLGKMAFIPNVTLEISSF